ncbi:MAG TPA: DUF3150 domain-containing protein [Smithellaceae bacterium]|nr:DUF3150 domain-containing protein [Smithellaceae bacterium]
MKEFQNVFRKACLIQLSTSTWMGSKMLDQSHMSKVAQNSEWLRGRKFLINPELLGPLHTSTHQARDLVKQYSLPFPITSLYLIPKESLAFVDERLAHQKTMFLEKVDAFIATYDLARDEAKRHLADLFNEADYPLDIRNKFKFEYRFLALDVPGKSVILSPEIFEREKKKFEDMMSEARDLAAVALREEFVEIVNSLVEKLSTNGGQPKTIKSSMFNKLHEFVSDLAIRNIFDDEKLMELADIARQTVSGISPYGLNYNGQMKERIKTSMGILKQAIEDSIEDLPKRKIRMSLAA